MTAIPWKTEAFAVIGDKFECHCVLVVVPRNEKARRDDGLVQTGSCCVVQAARDSGV